MKIFYSPTQGKMNFQEVAREIADYFHIDPQADYRLIIGTDSEGRGSVDFVTAIVIHRKGKGGRYFWTKKVCQNIYHLSQKIHQEVQLSIDLTLNLLSYLKKYWASEIFEGALEIHIDVGENGPTRELIQEVVGMVRAYGFEAKTKPASYGASVVADRQL